MTTPFEGHCEQPRAVLSVAQEESCLAFVCRARFHAQFTLSGRSETLRSAQDDKRRARNGSPGASDHTDSRGGNGTRPSEACDHLGASTLPLRLPDQVPPHCLNGVLAGVLHQPEAVIKSVLHHRTNHVEIANRGPTQARDSTRAECLALPPPRQPCLPSPSHSSTSAAQGGYDVPFQFQGRAFLDNTLRGAIIDILH